MIHIQLEKALVNTILERLYLLPIRNRLILNHY